MHCSNCRDPLTEYANEEAQLGRCCVSLPYSWSASAPGHPRGFVTAAATGQVAVALALENEDDTTPATWRCPHCGSREDVNIAYHEVHTGQLSPARIEERMAYDNTPWWDSDDAEYAYDSNLALTCVGCSADVTNSFDRE